MASVAMLEMWAGHPTYPCDILYTPFFLARRAPSSRRYVCGVLAATRDFKFDS